MKTKRQPESIEWIEFEYKNSGWARIQTEARSVDKFNEKSVNAITNDWFFAQTINEMSVVNILNGQIHIGGVIFIEPNENWPLR